MSEDKTSRIAKGQHILPVMTPSPSMFRLDGEVVSKSISYLQVSTASDISCFTLDQDHNKTTLGASPSQASPGRSFLQPSNYFACTHASQTTGCLKVDSVDFSVPPTILDIRSPPGSDFAPGPVQTIYSPAEPQFDELSTAVEVRRSLPTPSTMHIDNIPWFKFMELVHIFLIQQRGMNSLSK